MRSLTALNDSFSLTNAWTVAANKELSFRRSYNLVGEAVGADVVDRISVELVEPVEHESPSDEGGGESDHEE